MPDPTGNKYLCAYLVAEETIEIDKLKQLLAKDLPLYMVPSVFMEIPIIAVNANEKVDRRALPEPDVSDKKRKYVAPRNGMEEKIAAIWQEVLGVEQAGIYDDIL